MQVGTFSLNNLSPLFYRELPDPMPQYHPSQIPRVRQDRHARKTKTITDRRLMGGKRQMHCLAGCKSGQGHRHAVGTGFLE